MISEIIAVVVLYNMKVSESLALKTINDSLQSLGVLDIVLYDNSENAMYHGDSLYENLNIIYKHDATNQGLGVAYNYAVNIGVEYEKKWIVLFDQDTIFTENLFSEYISSIKKYPKCSLFAPILKLDDNSIFSPSCYFFKRGFKLKRVSVGIQSLSRMSPVNSGMMIRIQDFKACGGYNEKIKLDFSDFQFIEKFKRKQNTFVIINSIGIQDFSNSISDPIKLNARYELFCQSVIQCERQSIIDGFQFVIVSFMRAFMLFSKTGKIIFFKTFLQYFIK